MSRSFPHGRILPRTLYQGHAKLETLVVTRIDRLVKKLRELQIVHEARENGVHLKATEQLIDTSTAAVKAFLDMLGRLRLSLKRTSGARQMGGHPNRHGARLLQGPAVDGRQRDQAPPR
jgi:DNA invertase Pin-like site-specific DNA recombinase